MHNKEVWSLIKERTLVTALSVNDLWTEDSLLFRNHIPPVPHKCCTQTVQGSWRSDSTDCMNCFSMWLFLPFITFQVKSMHLESARACMGLNPASVQPHTRDADLESCKMYRVTWFWIASSLLTQVLDVGDALMQYKNSWDCTAFP